ncbi:PaaI family thioesterase [Tropicibacter sp. Alg240-R139]|uniref:PaaI family thioesterase n=1 Tax=Tropicibacter sp. Alg240-R139 TaxID=2305991 RepID=UPI0013E02983|nr:PaaI family thioesterase [Tropicibacter sp. Alg240-R139]
MPRHPCPTEPIALFQFLGMALEIDLERLQAHCVLEVSDMVRNRQRVLYGGVIPTVLDAASGITASLSCDPEGLAPFATVLLNINYIAPAKQDAFHATGRTARGRAGHKVRPLRDNRRNGTRHRGIERRFQMATPTHTGGHMTEVVRTERRGHALIVWNNNPRRRNPVSPEYYQALVAALARVRGAQQEYVA